MSVAVDKLLKSVRHKNIWEIVDFCIMVWAKKHPEDHKKFLKEAQNYKKSRKKETGATQDNTRRTLVAIPHEIDYLLQKIAKHRIEEYGRTKFYRDFAKRYPGFRTSEKL